MYVCMYVCMYVRMYVIQSFLTRIICCRIDTDAVSRFYGKVTFVPICTLKTYGTAKLHIYTLTSAPDGKRGQFHDPAASPHGRSPAVHSEYETEWARESIWTPGKRGKFLASTGHLPTTSVPYCLCRLSYPDSSLTQVF